MPDGTWLPLQLYCLFVPGTWLPLQLYCHPVWDLVTVTTVLPFCQGPVYCYNCIAILPGTCLPLQLYCLSVPGTCLPLQLYCHSARDLFTVTTVFFTHGVMYNERMHVRYAIMYSFYMLYNLSIVHCRLYEPKPNKKVVRIFTVILYMFSGGVSSKSDI